MIPPDDALFFSASGEKSAGKIYAAIFNPGHVVHCMMIAYADCGIYAPFQSLRAYSIPGERSRLLA
ncbi:MAG: hypothetical protein CMN55_04260 [Sneathiella sp.]|nr:hypothetical protein [Sneathiella sp.]